MPQVNKHRWRFPILISISILLVLAQSAALLYYNRGFLAISLFAALLLAIIWLVRFKSLGDYVGKSITASAELFAEKESRVLTEFSAPVILLSNSGEIVWYNIKFKKLIPDNINMLGKDFYSLLGSKSADEILNTKTTEMTFNNRIFKVFLLDNEANKAVYLVDQTDLKKTASEYRFSRPVVAVLAVDSLNEILSDVKESIRAQVCGKIQDIIESWFADTGGIMHTVSKDRFMLIFEQRYLKKFEDEKFIILEQIRNFEFSGYSGLTLSIGVGYGCRTMSECELLAKKALDMSLGRGGDQAAVKSPSADYKFFGGVKAVSEKSTRVRTRIMASALSDLIRNADRVILMGHKYSDLDCLGSAFALATTIRNFDKPVNVVIDTETSMAGRLIDYINSSGYNEVFCGREIIDKVDSNTLLIVTDTHRPGVVEFEDIYHKAGKVAVIDHHRRATDAITGAVIFYNETVASSTCEMVSELVQYMNPEAVGAVQANALLAGMMLDTKNFVMGAGVRTFEAAAFLRKKGADPVLVKKMFADSIESYKKKYEVISTAFMYNGCVIAVNDSDSWDARLISAQAADELLNINNVHAAFSVYRQDGKICISARSYGQVNVQLVAESLGGGGHRVMAACTLDTDSFDTAVDMLKNAIDEYNRKR